MKEEATKAGRLYGVCSAGECIVTDAETGFVLATIDGTKQEAFIAPGSLVYVSDDAAVVTEVFKLAPCRGVAAMMLLRAAGGLLPKGFTELEYLETSGTQYIDTGIVKSGAYRARFEYAAPPYFNNGIMFGWQYNYQSALHEESFSFFATASYFGRFVHWSSNSYILPPNFSATGYDGTARNVLETTSAADVVILNGETVQLYDLGNTRNTENPLNATIVVLRGTSGAKVFAFTIFNESGLADIELTPVLDADGTPCMYDKVSKQCFYNKGTGTFGYRIKRTGETVAPMSLRDPYYTAPSGVYARRAGENELEVLADTEETTGEGWEWFSNTAEAYESFGIKQEEILTE